MPSLETTQLLSVAADACDSRKAEDIRILALDPSESALTDYFLICNGTNERQNVAISDEIEIRLKQEFGLYPTSIEGRRQGEWVLMDYVDFIVHIFMPEQRAHYGLERLKKSAKSLTVAELNEELRAALAKTSAKRPAKRAAVKVEPGIEGATSGSASGKKPVPAKKTASKAVKAPAAARKAAPAAKKAAKKSVVKKAAAKKTPAKKAAKATAEK
jgi:ribosome-associated protein